MNSASLPYAAPSSAGAQSGAATNLSGVLEEIRKGINEDHPDDQVKLGAILNAVGRRAYGPLLLVIGLVAISPLTIVPGANWLTAVLILLIAGQMMLGLKRPWVPPQALRLSFSRQAVLSALDKASPWARRVDVVLKPRLTFFTEPLWVNLAAAFCVLAGLVTIPLALIPFGPVAPSLAVVIFGLGMTAKDGLWIVLGSAVSVAALALAIPLIL